jgi:hypothetical protein
VEPFSEEQLRALTTEEGDVDEAALAEAWREGFEGDIDGLYDYVDRCVCLCFWLVVVAVCAFVVARLTLLHVLHTNVPLCAGTKSTCAPRWQRCTRSPATCGTRCAVHCELAHTKQAALSVCSML